jgi:signal transduction histidine kinase
VLAAPDGVTVRFNPAAEAFLAGRARAGTTVAELVDLVTPAGDGQRRPDLAVAARAPGGWHGTLDLLDGHDVRVPHACTVVSSPEGILLHARDLRDQRAREAAERELAGRDEFVARLGHELRTPLNAMLGFAQLLELEDPTADQQASIERILVGGRHMQSLLDDVLDLARLRTGGTDLDVGPVPVLDVVQGVVDLVEPLADRRAIRRYVDPQTDLVALADRRRLWQVLLNLIGNAVKYGREGGTVRVGVTAESGAGGPEGTGGADGSALVRIEVEDDGPGIEPAQLSRLFRPFERLGQERTAVEGSGLGLAMSQALVTAMDGRLSARSRLGQGTTFAVELPALDRRDLDEPPVLDRARGTATVVYVSGDAGAQAMVAAALRTRLDVDVAAVTRAAEALVTIRRIQPPMVLLDSELPDATATELLHRLGGDPLSTLVPKVVLTFDPDPAVRLRLRAAGAAEVLPLPLDVRHLLDVVRRSVRPGRTGPERGTD